MIKVSKYLLLVSIIAAASNTNALGYISRDCPAAGAMESFTMSWTNEQWMYTRSFLPRINSGSPNGYNWQEFTSGSNWELLNRSAAGIHPWTSISTDLYYRAVYGFHYWYNERTHTTESRSRMVQNDCDLLNWGVNNW